MSCERSNTSMTTSTTLTTPVVSNVNVNKITERKDGDSTIVKVGFEQKVTAASPEELWETRYKELVSFVKEFGHARVPYNFYPNTSLGNWVSHQRGYYKDVQEGNPSVSMTEYRIKLLKEVGFEWEGKVPKWDTRYEELSYFVKEFGHARVPQIFQKNPSLGNWIKKQRAGRKKMQRGDPSSMTKRRLELLDKIYFEWEGRGKGVVIPSEEWEVKYEELVSFAKEFGHARVPLKNPSLGYWVSKQRIYHKMIPKGNTPVHLTDRKISLLEKVGFEWEVKKNPEWDEQYKHLVSFVKEFGHSRVPSKFQENPSLGYWVNRQRTYYQKIQKGESSTLTEVQINLLNKVDFEWKCRAGAEVVVVGWDARYKDLVTFINEFGHTRVPYNFPPNTSLGRWVDSQRLSYKKFQEGDTSARMTECRIGLLKKVGFEWVVRVPEWDTRYKELVSFIEEFGHSRIPKRFPQNPSLGRWVGKQRVNYKKFKNGSTSARMTESRVNLLDKIGFEWEASIKGKTAVWDKRYEELVSFVDEFGHARVPFKFPPNTSLGRWVNQQRKNYRKFREGASSTCMTESRIKLLDEIGLNDRTVSL